MKEILVYLGMEKHPSPYDILFAYDSGFDIVLPYSQVQEQEVIPLVQDIMFPRGAGGARHTTLFIGGSDITLVEKIAKGARKIMFPPYLISIVHDPRGAYTTASALIAKIIQALGRKAEKLEGKQAVVLGGSGAVGRITSRLLIEQGVDVIISSRNYQGTAPYRDIIEAAKKSNIEESNRRIGKLTGIRMRSAEERFKFTRDRQIVLSTGRAGVEMLPDGCLERLDQCLFAGDINAVPPAGIAGIEADFDLTKVASALTVGACSVGKLKNRIALKMLNHARRNPGVYLDCSHAFAFARELSGI
jgi:methylene-tetrahydromethanopterin dehydrogenase